MSRLAIRGGTPVRTRPFTSWPVFDQHEEEAVLNVLRSGNWWWNACGDVEDFDAPSAANTTQFARRFAEYHGTAYGIPCANGSSALEVALKALGIGPGDEVIVPPYTFIATATAPLHVNATPIFCDIDYDTFNLSPAALVKSITPRTRAIIPVHFAGAAADMEAILNFARRGNIVVLEDAAHAHGGAWNDRMLGSLGNASTFSFQFSKNMTAGEGGIILSNDPEVAALCESYVWGGRKAGRPWYEHHRLGWNYRLTELQAAILLAQLDRLPSQTAQRKANGLFLAENLAQIPGLAPLYIPAYATTPTFHIFVLRFDEEKFGIPREEFLTALEAEGVPCSSGYAFPLYKNPLFLNRNFYPSRTTGTTGGPIGEVDYAAFAACCPNAERACRTAVWLEQRLLLGSQEDMRDIVRAVEKIWQCRAELQRDKAPTVAG